MLIAYYEGICVEFERKNKHITLQTTMNY